MMSTLWDDDRVVLEVKERSSRDPITGLDNVGWVVQILDAGPLAARHPRPKLMFDSDMVHHEAGVFHDHAAAQEFGDRMRAGTLRQQQEIERIRHARKEVLSERQLEHWAEQARQKALAAAATKAAREADEAARKLAVEADAPEVALSCNPTGEGWSLWLGPSLTDGTEGGDPRQLVMEGLGIGLKGPQRLAGAGDEKPKATRLPPKRKGSKPASPTARPEEVPDAQGFPIGRGSAVTLSGEDDARATVVEIGAFDVKAGQWTITVEREDGGPADVLASECMRVDDEVDGAA